MGTTHIYDSVFKTVANKLPSLMVPLEKEVESIMDGQILEIPGEKCYRLLYEKKKELEAVEREIAEIEREKAAFEREIAEAKRERAAAEREKAVFIEGLRAAGVDEQVIQAALPRK